MPDRPPPPPSSSTPDRPARPNARPKRRPPRATLAALAAAIAASLATACGAAPTPPPRFGAATAAAPTAAPALPTVDIAARDDLERLLTDAGIPWTYGGEKQVDWFETVPHIYHVGDAAAGDTLEVHVHPDTAAAQAAAARVSPGGGTILDAAGDRIQVLWGATPHFFQKGPFLVIYVGGAPAVLEALTRAFGPQFAGG